LTSAVSGIEQALWDISGKMLGVPVYKLMGGPVRDRMRVYGWIGGDRPSDVASAAAEKLRFGMTAVKMNGTAETEWIDGYEKIDEVVERIGAVHDATEGKVGIAVDFHGRVHRSIARSLMKELEPYRLLFVEEPVLPENMEALTEIRRHSTVPIATGERIYTRWGFKELLHGGAVDIIQPDVSHCGGIWEMRKIAAMAEAYDVAVAPHCPLGPIALASCLQVDFCTVNAAIQEQSLNIHYNKGADILDYLKCPSVFAYREGYVDIPVGPGLGIEVDEETVMARTDESLHWKNPVWRNPDGCIAEW
jgi:galactonate dehydratase